MILIVDDHREIGRAVVLMLKSQRYEAECVTGGQQAIDYLGGARPDLMFLDCNMPGVGGLEVLRHVRGDARLVDMPVVMHSAGASLQLRGDLERAGIQGWIAKDLSSSDEIVNFAQRYGVPT
jgi:CheY-like chemotaxis protein